MSKQRQPVKPQAETDWLAVIQPYLPIIGILTLAILAVVFVVGYWLDNSTTQPGHWAELADAQADDPDGESLASFAGKSNVAGTPAGTWAQLLLADKKLAQATRDVFADREGAKEKLQDAKKAYMAAEKSAGDNLMIKVRSQFGIAQANEAAGDLKGAASYYELVAKGTDKVFAQRAKEALERVNNEANREFAAWFTSQPSRQPAKKNSFDLNPPPLGGFSPGGLLPETGGTKTGRAPEAPSSTTDDSTPELNLGTPDDSEKNKENETTDGTEGKPIEEPKSETPGETPKTDSPEPGKTESGAEAESK